jgi:predicted unusual protein kinase regulating ubiquinone biosynthesis (AarF/ABC1/UbiB family)
LQAFAAASLGQVHRAVLPDGRQVAVKVQYPGIKETITSDLKLVKALILPALKTKLSKKYLESVTAELAQRLFEETDYRGEAERGQWFYDHMSREDVFIPQPIPEYSGNTVLTSEYVDGTHLSQWLEQRPSQGAINRACQAILDLHTESLMEHGVLHCDPNPGNYLFLKDGRVALIDYGCVKFYSKDAMDRISQAIRANVQGDKEAMYQGLGLLGLDMKMEASREYFEKYLFPFLQVFRKPHDYQIFDFKEHRSFIRDLISKGAQVFSAGHMLIDFTPETIHIDRTYHGIYRIFDMLGAEVRFRHPLLWEQSA